MSANPLNTNLNFSRKSGLYRYSFNGKENESTSVQGAYDFGARIYDGRLGRFYSVDPLKQFPSNYTGNGNDPVNGNDPSGMLFFRLFGSTKQQREQARLYELRNGGITKDVWKESIHNEGKDYFGGSELSNYTVDWVQQKDGSYTLEYMAAQFELVLETTYFDSNTGKITTQNPSKSENPPGLEFNGDLVKFGDNVIYSDQGMQGEEGLRKYSSAIDETGDFLEDTKVLAPIGKVLSTGSLLIETGLDYETYDNSSANLLLMTRIAFKITDKIVDSATDKLPGADIPLGDGLDVLEDKTIQEIKKIAKHD